MCYLVRHADEKPTTQVQFRVKQSFYLPTNAAHDIEDVVGFGNACAINVASKIKKYISDI